MSFILGHARSSVISHHNSDVFESKKVNGWLGNDERNGMIIKINLRGNEKEE